MHPRVDLYFVEIPLYTALVALGALVGCLVSWLYLRTRSRRASALGTWLDGTVIAFAVGWLGARAYHVAMHWDYYTARPEEILQPDLGGLGIRGALIAGGLALLIYARARQISFWHFADAAALGLALGQTMGWAGALAHGANYGVISDSNIAMDLADLYGLIQPRFPIQLAEIVLFSMLFIGLLVIAQQRQPGSMFVAYLAIASAANFVLGFQRGDLTPVVGALTVDQLVDVLLTAFALTVWLRKQIRTDERITEIGVG